MIDSPPHGNRVAAFRDEDGLPPSLVPGGNTPPNGKQGYEGIESQVAHVEEYSHTYGQK
jgi:hypothetical protein